MVQALCDLADGYAKEGLWPQVRHTVQPRRGAGRAVIPTLVYVGITVYAEPWNPGQALF